MEHELVVTNVQIFPLKESMGKLRGFARVLLNDELQLTGLRIFEGVNGFFVAYPKDPSYKEYRQLYYPVTRDLREHIDEVCINKYLEITGQEPHVQGILKLAKIKKVSKSIRDRLRVALTLGVSCDKAQKLNEIEVDLQEIEALRGQLSLKEKRLVAERALLNKKLNKEFSKAQDNRELLEDFCLEHVGEMVANRDPDIQAAGAYAMKIK